MIDNPQHIFANPICHGNTPPAQFNPLDGGAANVVDARRSASVPGSELHGLLDS